MDVWILFYNTHMANNLVKWWRTKFLNGYKQFSDCGDVKVSDTEELLGRYDSDDENFDRIGRCQTPPCQERLSRANPSSTISENDEDHAKNESPRLINLEELICDVSMDNTDPAGQEKQEFSFTLYDFDGHGKITKDDIAGLVTTIYEALGSSVKVPHCGSKTIKVKLTVSPEPRSTENEKTHVANGKNSNIRYKKDINVTIRQATKENRRYCESNSKNRRKHHCCKRNEEEQQKHHCCKKEEENEEQNLVSDDFSDICSRISSAHSSSSEDECENDQSSDHEHTPQKVKQKKYTKRPNSRYTIPTLFLKDIYNHQEKCSKSKKGRNRSSSLQRQELLEIIQANMEKNNLSFQTIGKPCTTQDNPELKSSSTESKHHHKHKGTTKTEAASPLHHYLANMVEPTQFYIDLASLQNATQLPTKYKYDKLIDAVIGVSNRKRPVTSQGKHRKHNRVKAECDNSVEYHLIDCPVNEEKTNSKLKKNNEQSNKKSAKKVHGVTGHTSSPHYLKHRNRQEDQARAMAQVVRWLEQEFSSNLTMKNSWEKTKNTGGFNSEKESANTPNNTPNTSKDAERHEHHHVHEHIHHHYHHYPETPFVV